MNKAKEEQMTTAQYKRVLSDFRKWTGPAFIVFTGGEALLRKDISLILADACEKGFMVELLTNGILLNEKNIEEIAGLGLWRITISFDGLNPATHDYIRGRKGSFDKTTKAFDLLVDLKKKYGYQYNILAKTVIMKPNLSEVAEIARWVRDHGLTGVFYQPIEQNYGQEDNMIWYKNSELWIDDIHMLEKEINELIRLKGAGLPIQNSIEDLEVMKDYFRNPDRLMKSVRYHVATQKNPDCLVGSASMEFSPNGDVRLCYGMEPIGNVVKTKPSIIWKHREVCWRGECKISAL